MDKYGTMLGRTIAYDAELIERLMHAINYRFGLCIEMIIQACAFAIDRHDGDITIDDFAGYYSFYTGCDLHENVFLNPNWAGINCDHQPCDEIVKPKARRKK